MSWDNEFIVKQIQTGEGERNELIERLWSDNIMLTRKIIHDLTGLDRGKWCDFQDFEDLEQQAFIGILEAVQRYDGTKGIKFFSFAVHYIRLSIYRYYDSSGQLIRIPAYMRKRIKDFLGERERLREKGVPVTAERIQEGTGMSGIAVRETLKAVQKLELKRLDSYLDEGDRDSGTVQDMIASTENTCDTAIESVHDRELHELLQAAIRELPEIERNIIIARHYQGAGNARIARIMKCTKQNVSQHAKMAYKRIRTGKYGKELAAFLPEHASRRAEKRIRDEFKELDEQERNLLI